MFSSRSAASATSSSSRYATPLVSRTAVADEGGRPRQPGLAHDVLEVGDVRALGEGHRLAAVVDAVLRRDLLDVVGLHAELSESVHPVQDGARVAAVSTLRRDHARHQDRAHPAHRRRAAAGARRRARTAGPTTVADSARRDARGTRRSDRATTATCRETAGTGAPGRWPRRAPRSRRRCRPGDSRRRRPCRSPESGTPVLPSNCKRLLVALADHHHVAARRHDAADHVPDVAHEIPIPRDQRPHVPLELVEPVPLADDGQALAASARRSAPPSSRAAWSRVPHRHAPAPRQGDRRRSASVRRRARPMARPTLPPRGTGRRSLRARRAGSPPGTRWTRP